MLREGTYRSTVFEMIGKSTFGLRAVDRFMLGYSNCNASAGQHTTCSAGATISPQYSNGVCIAFNASQYLSTASRSSANEASVNVMTTDSLASGAGDVVFVPKSPNCDAASYTISHSGIVHKYPEREVASNRPYLQSLAAFESTESSRQRWQTAVRTITALLLVGVMLLLLRRKARHYELLPQEDSSQNATRWRYTVDICACVTVQAVVCISTCVVAVRLPSSQTDVTSSSLLYLTSFVAAMLLCWTVCFTGSLGRVRADRTWSSDSAACSWYWQYAAIGQPLFWVS